MFSSIIHPIKILFSKYINVIQKHKLKTSLTASNSEISKVAMFHPHLHYYSSNIYLLLSALTLYQKQHTKALEFCNLSIFHNPQYTYAQSIKNSISSNTLLSNRKLKEIIKEITTLEKLITQHDHIELFTSDISDTNNLYYQANAYLYLDKLEEAADSLKNYIKNNNTNVAALCDLGRILIQQQKYKDAEHHLERCLKLKEDYFPIYLWLGVCNIFLNKIEKAKSLLLKSMNILKKEHDQYHKNFSKLYSKRGNLHYKIGAIDLSLNDLHKSLDLDQHNIDALLLRSKILLSKTNYTDAILDIEKIERLLPKHRKVTKMRTHIKKHHRKLKDFA